ncbi:helix-turn-helix domain-containing protein [Lactococcus allomyrinae]|uniref:XRE family transcriptional regulator n=1 Tax=Lactococcus allomyrinae TaxID=2419773 RepID=A0A387BFW8_9LACT|nr:helix-turn-helix transcriptional regulator [Lactococcus allomyrinae]AYG01164.1 XRE family transcriptional regulator [Lactococcus allomyrinae]
MAKNKIAEILKEKQMKKSVFADLTGIARQNVNLMLTQKQGSISYENIQSICEVLSISPNELFEIGERKDYMIVNTSIAKTLSVNDKWTSQFKTLNKFSLLEAQSLCKVLNEERRTIELFPVPIERLPQLVIMEKQMHRPRPLVKKYLPPLVGLWKFNKAAGSKETVIKGSVQDFQSWFLEIEQQPMDNSRFRGYVLKTAITSLEETYSVKCVLETLKSGRSAKGYRLKIKEID